VAIPVFVGRSSTACFVGRSSTACSCRPFVDSVLVVWRLHRLVLRFRLSVVGQPRGPFGHTSVRWLLQLACQYVHTCSRDHWRFIGLHIHSCSPLFDIPVASFVRSIPSVPLHHVIRCSWPCHVVSRSFIVHVFSLGSLQVSIPLTIGSSLLFLSPSPSLPDIARAWASRARP